MTDKLPEVGKRYNFNNKKYICLEVNTKEAKYYFQELGKYNNTPEEWYLENLDPYKEIPEEKPVDNNK
tara:strand:+ start:28 stop:231 length:204 start_codon:yes stop_codon:yes gene_type:complete